MTQSRKWHSRRAFYALLIVALVALTIPISYAAARTTNSRATAPVVKYPNGCSFPTNKTKVVGSATLDRNKDGSITVDYEVNGVTPGKYYLYFYADNNDGSPACNIGYFAGYMSVDGNGRGNKTYVVPASDVSGYHIFWAYSEPKSTDTFQRSASVSV